MEKNLTSDKTYISLMLNSIEKIEEFSSGLSFEDFEQNQQTQSATMMQLLLIGEVSKSITDESKNLIDLPWKNIAGFRDKAIHNYFQMELDIVWETVQNNIPILKKELATFISANA